MSEHPLDHRQRAANLLFHLKLLVSLIFALILTNNLQANAQSTVFEERHKVSGWEEPLCNRDNNLRHYYWTDIDASSRYRVNVINRVAPSKKSSYTIINRTASPNKPSAMSAKARKVGDNQIASGDVSGYLRNQQQAASYGNRSVASTYGSYSFSQPVRSTAQYDSNRNVKGRVLSY